MILLTSDGITSPQLEEEIKKSTCANLKKSSACDNRLVPVQRKRS